MSYLDQEAFVEGFPTAISSLGWILLNSRYSRMQPWRAPPLSNIKATHANAGRNCRDGANRLIGTARIFRNQHNNYRG
jgi:hypothetical protein